MVTNVEGIHRGMEVFAVDGEMIGVVLDVRGPDTDTELGTGPDVIAGGTRPEPADTAAGQPMTGAPGLGSAPSGTTADKGRGAPTASSASVERGDIHTTGVGQSPAEPGAGGADALRGYGTPGDQGGVPLTTGESAERLEALRGGGVAGPSLTARSHTRSGYIMVEDKGVLGVGAGGLRIPFDAILDVMPGRRITLDCTRRQAHERYGPGPSLEIDESAPLTPF
jgi:hypothetical protein